MRNLFTIVALIASVSFAHAGDVVLLGRPGNTWVFVWKNYEAFGSAVEAIRAGRQREALAYTSCVVPVGTEAMIMGRAGVASKRVLLVDGCSGIVNDEDINGRRDY